MGTKSKRKKRAVVATPDDDDDEKDDGEKKDVVSLLSTLQNLLKCDGCQNAFFVSSPTSSSSKREPITLHCGHTICRECGIRATEPRKGFYEAFCPSSTRCSERVFAKDFSLEGEKVGRLLLLLHVVFLLFFFFSFRFAARTVVLGRRKRFRGIHFCLLCDELGENLAYLFGVLYFFFSFCVSF